MWAIALGPVRAPRCLAWSAHTFLGTIVSALPQPDCSPMADLSLELPEVEPSDPEPVAVAIETARALFRTGEHLDALRWLRRAAERAEESGDDVRAVHLAHKAADLSTALQSAPAPKSVRRHDEAVALAAYDDFSDKTVVDATLPLVREALQTNVQITDMPASSERSPHSVTMPSPSSNESSESRVTSAEATPVSEVAMPAVRSALRVAVTRDPASPGTWLVRPLAEGSEVPAGCEEALLIPFSLHSNLLE